MYDSYIIGVKKIGGNVWKIKCYFDYQYKNIIRCDKLLDEILEYTSKINNNSRQKKVIIRKKISKKHFTGFLFDIILITYMEELDEFS